MSYNIDHYYGEFIPVEKERIQLQDFEHNDIFIDRVWKSFSKHR